MFSVGSDATDDFSVDRSYLNSAPVRENTPRFGGPSRTRPSSIEQVSNSRFNERPGFGQSSMSNRPADRNPDSPGRGFAFGRNKDKGRDNPGRGNAFGRDKDNKDERKAQRKAERRERMKGELLDKAKRKKREKRGRERD